MKVKFRRKLEFIYVWFKHVVLRIKIPLEAIELVEKHFKATKSEKKLIQKIKEINLNNKNNEKRKTKNSSRIFNRTT